MDTWLLLVRNKGIGYSFPFHSTENILTWTHVTMHGRRIFWFCFCCCNVCFFTEVHLIWQKYQKGDGKIGAPEGELKPGKHPEHWERGPVIIYWAYPSTENFTCGISSDFTATLKQWHYYSSVEKKLRGKIIHN